MSIQHIESTRLFHLKTKNSSYQMKADSPGTLLHLYYGEAVTDDMSYLVLTDRTAAIRWTPFPRNTPEAAWAITGFPRFR